MLIHSVDNPDLPPEEWTAVKELSTSSSSEEEVLKVEENVDNGNENEIESEKEINGEVLETEAEEKKDSNGFHTDDNNGYVNDGFILDEKTQYESIGSLTKIKCVCPKCLDGEEEAHLITDSNRNSNIGESDSGEKSKNHRTAFCPCEHCMSMLVEKKLSTNEDDQNDIDNAQTLPIR